MLNEDLCADAHQNDAAEYLGLTAQPAAEFLPSRWPARQQTNVTQAMKEAAAAMFTSSAAKLTPTASASMLVAKACTTISL